MAQNLPFAYDTMNANDGPNMLSFVHIHNTDISRYFKRYLLQEVLTIFDFTLPPEWDENFFKMVLMGCGFLAVFDSGEFGIIPQNCTLSGRNVFYRPARAIVANPLLNGSRNMRIGDECVLIQLMPDFGNICDIVETYGDMLALAYETTAVNILNSKLSYVFPVSNKAEADAMKAVSDEVNSGHPSVFVRKSAGISDAWQPFQQNVGQNFIAPELLETMRTVRDMFLCDIGIPNIASRKRERVNVDETNKNSIETQCKALLWLEEMQRGFRQAREMFPEFLNEQNFNVKLRFKEEGGNAGETVSSGPVSV